MPYAAGGGRLRVLGPLATVAVVGNASGCHYDDWSLPAASIDAAAHDAPAQLDAPGDVATGPDAGPILEAAVEAEASAPTWCQTQGVHSFCADFDEGQADLGWTMPDLSAGGSIKLDSAFTTSAPDSLLTTLIGSSAGSTTALLAKNFPTSQSSWAFAFDLRIDSIMAGTSGGDYSVARIWGGSQSRVTLHTNGNTIWMDEDIPTVDSGSFSSHAVSMPVPVGMWQRFEIDVSLGNPTRVVNVLAGPTRTNVCTFTLTSTFVNGSPEFDLGVMSFGTNTAGCSARYDDVLIDVAP
jgi:hypothetical protein